MPDTHYSLPACLEWTLQTPVRVAGFNLMGATLPPANQPGYYPTEFFVWGVFRYPDNTRSELPLFAARNRSYYQPFYTSHWVIQFEAGVCFYDSSLVCEKIRLRVDATPAGVLDGTISMQLRLLEELEPVCAEATATSTVSQQDAALKAELAARQLAVQAWRQRYGQGVASVRVLRDPQIVVVNCGPPENPSETTATAQVIPAVMSFLGVADETHFLNLLDDLQYYLNLLRWNCPAA